MASSGLSKVCIQKSSYSSVDVNSLMAHLGGMGKFVKKGERVLLKINMLSGMDPAKAVTTHPAVVSAVADAVIAQGGIPYIGDSPAGFFNKRSLEKAYERSGMKAIAKEKGIELSYDTGSRKVQIPGAQRLKHAPICNYILNADKVIALPKLKTHAFMTLTLSAKLMYGAIPGISKTKYHSFFPNPSAFADVLLDVFSARKPDLFIMDAITGMHGNGPQNGKPIEIGLLLASDDAIALDITACRIIGAEPMKIPVLKNAHLRGMWPARIDYPALRPDQVLIDGFELPSTAKIFGASGPARMPSPNEKCIACGKCQEICPRGAAKVIDGKARIDLAKCIRCYCCHEVCPANAIDLISPDKK
jgi:uncharacterized protein (DUF362 family)/NAD-dependent dihydropyrimidine dehydrogenase PreA subunit